jgi:protein TonB
VREGDALTAETRLRLENAVQAFDPNLSTRVATVHSDDGRSVWTVFNVLGREQPRPSITVVAPPDSPQPASVQRVKVAGNVQAALLLAKEPVIFPVLAQAAQVSGVVHLAVIVRPDGTVQEVHSLGGPALLISAAMDAVKQWVYRPARLNGQPVEVETTVDVNFNLSQ